MGIFTWIAASVYTALIAAASFAQVFYRRERHEKLVLAAAKEDGHIAFSTGEYDIQLIKAVLLRLPPEHGQESRLLFHIFKT